MSIMHCIIITVHREAATHNATKLTQCCRASNAHEQASLSHSVSRVSQTNTAVDNGASRVPVWLDGRSVLGGSKQDRADTC